MKPESTDVIILLHTFVYYSEGKDIAFLKCLDFCSFLSQMTWAALAIHVYPEWMCQSKPCFLQSFEILVQKAFYKHKVEKHHWYSFTAVAFLSGIFPLFVNIVQKDWPHLHYKYHSFNGLEVGKSTRVGGETWALLLEGLRLVYPLKLVGHNQCGYHELFRKDLGMKVLWRCVHLGCNECLWSDCSDSRENHSHGEDPQKGHLE